MSRPKGVAAVFVLLCLGLVAYGCGSDDSPSQADIQNEVQTQLQEQLKQQKQKQQLENLQNQVKELRNKTERDSPKVSGSPIDPSGPASSCAAGVRVGPNTSCSFAMNVAGEYGSNPGAASIRAYSPVTGEYYTMGCVAWSGGGTVCTGGNGAAVYLP